MADNWSDYDHWKTTNPDDETLGPKPECPKCEGSGEVAIEVGVGTYRGPGPVPDGARGVVGVGCRWCGGTGEADE